MFPLKRSSGTYEPHNNRWSSVAERRQSHMLLAEACMWIYPSDILWGAAHSWERADVVPLCLGYSARDFDVSAMCVRARPFEEGLLHSPFPLTWLNSTLGSSKPLVRSRLLRHRDRTSHRRHRPAFWTQPLTWNPARVRDPYTWNSYHRNVLISFFLTALYAAKQLPKTVAVAAATCCWSRCFGILPQRYECETLVLCSVYICTCVFAWNFALDLPLVSDEQLYWQSCCLSNAISKEPSNCVCGKVLPSFHVATILCQIIRSVLITIVMSILWAMKCFSASVFSYV